MMTCSVHGDACPCLRDESTARAVCPTCGATCQPAESCDRWACPTHGVLLEWAVLGPWVRRTPRIIRAYEYGHRVGQPSHHDAESDDRIASVKVSAGAALIAKAEEWARTAQGR